MLTRKRYFAIAVAFALAAVLGVAVTTLDGMETTAGTSAETTVVQEAVRP
jgi:hypothetical protein